jgi:TPR repeat protein/serine/threonine protein kinase
LGYAQYLQFDTKVQANLTEARKYFRLAADQGDVDAQLHSAHCAYQGKGGPVNLVEASIYFKHAADSGNADAQLILGIFHFLGIGSCLDIEAAEDMFKLSADQGNMHGQFNYAMTRLRHVQSKRDRFDILKYLKLSADQGCLLAQVDYGVCLFRGFGVALDLCEAARYFGMASGRGEPHGSFNYGLCLFDGQGVSIDQQQAFRCFGVLAAHNDARGLVNVGYCLHTGLGTVQDWSTSVKYFREAAESGNAVGQFNYGICCSRGEGVCVDFVEALEYFIRSADQKYPPAQFACGLCFHLGRGVPRDTKFARRYFVLSVESGKPVEHEWDHLRRIEKPIEVLSLSGVSLLHSESNRSCISLSLATHEQSYFGRIHPLSALKFDRSRHKKKLHGKAENRADSPVDLDRLHEIMVLGFGVVGVVKLMEDEDGERYAVKYFTRMWHQTSLAVSAAFEREFDACCKLNHPCIVPHYGFSPATERGDAALVMKYMENGSLADVLANVKRGSPPSFWTHTGIAIIVCGIVYALEFIHSKGYTHRDLRPSNLLIDKDGRCYVGDLGSSRSLKGATHLSDDKSTVTYSAPELYDRQYTTKIDVFSFSLILYEILVGKAVFAGNIFSDAHIVYMAVTGVRAELPQEMLSNVKSLICRSWSTDPDHRPSFSDIRAHLERVHFKILPDVNSAAVKRFVNDIHCQQSNK